MKIRNGFVSNSSSSSFMVAIDKEKKSNEVRIVIDVGLDEIDNVILETEEELRQYYIDNYCDSLDDFLSSSDEDLDQYKEYLNQIKKGKKLIVCCVSSEEAGIEEVIYGGKYKLIGGEDLGEIY